MRLLEKFKNKKLSIGPFSKCSDPAMIECIGLAGFDFVVIDLEHGPNSIETAQNLVRAATLHKITPIIRVNKNNESMISKALDIGAQGIQVPQINDDQGARNVVNAARFSPLGNRGICRYVRAAEYSKKNKLEYFEQSNDNTLIIIQIEGKKGLENIDSILQVEGIDIVFIGPYDLSQSMGVPGQTNHPKVLGAMKMVTEKASHYNKIVGTFIETPADLKIWKDLGLLYLSYKVDVGIFYDACHNLFNELNEVWNGLISEPDEEKSRYVWRNHATISYPRIFKFFTKQLTRQRDMARASKLHLEAFFRYRIEKLNAPEKGPENKEKLDTCLQQMEKLGAEMENVYGNDFPFLRASLFKEYVQQIREAVAKM